MMIKSQEPPAKFNQLYDLLCLLPIIVEYPLNWQRNLSYVQKNSIGRSSFLKPLKMDLPDFSKQYKVADDILFPDNQDGLATAHAVEQVLGGGQCRSTFGGIGNAAATEEILLSLYMLETIKPTWNLTILQELTELCEEIFTISIPKHKPIIGRNIFAVESGIHVDGITKKPVLYELFSPKTVGLSRKIMLGSHSGHASLKIKLQELNLTYDEAFLDLLLLKVKHHSLQHKRSVNDEELKKWWREYHEQNNPFD